MYVSEHEEPLGGVLHPAGARIRVAPRVDRPRIWGRIGFFYILELVYAFRGAQPIAILSQEDSL